MAQAAAPKMDFKMFIMPAMLILSRQISFTVPNPNYPTGCEGEACPDIKVTPKEINNEDVVQKAQMGLMCVALFLLTLYYYCYNRVGQSGGDSKKVCWVPPKPKPSLPFGLGPAPEPIKLEDFTETTLEQYEVSLVKEQAQALIFPIAIAYFMSLKFNVHVSLLMQGVMLPVNALDSAVLKKYILGSKNNGTSETMYGELYTAPTEAMVKALNDAAGAAVADADADAPRVEELPDDADVKKVEKTEEEKAAMKAKIAADVEAHKKKNAEEAKTDNKKPDDLD